MKRIALLVLVVAFGVGACERHSFEETKKLHEHHDGAEHKEGAEGDGAH